MIAKEVGSSPTGWMYKYSLKRRPYVSTTTLEPRLTLLLANLACVGPTTAVLDPYCGSGGTLLAAAHMGASACVGVDINGTISTTRVWSNFFHADLNPPTAYIFGDCGSQELQDRELVPLGPYDAIITDPPYGKREKGAVGAQGSANQAAVTLMELAANNEILKVNRQGNTRLGNKVAM